MVPALSPAPPKPPDRGVPVGAAEAIAYGSLNALSEEQYRAALAEELHVGLEPLRLAAPRRE